MQKPTAVITSDPLPAEVLDTLEDVALRLRCHKRTVARAVAAGLFHPVRFNSRLIRFRRSEVERWIAQAEGSR